jgi:hypothetical protein
MMITQRTHLCILLLHRVHDDGPHIHDEHSNNNTNQNESDVIIFERIKDVLLTRLFKRGNKTSRWERLIKVLLGCPRSRSSKFRIGRGLDAS